MKKLVSVLLLLTFLLSVLSSCAGTTPGESDTGETGTCTPTAAETLPDETAPDETQPEETQPDETQAAETQPEDTLPAETEPEETEPVETQPVIEVRPPMTPAADVTFTFAVMSDVHLGDKQTTESFDRIMTYMASLDTAPEAYLFAGDLTNGTGTSGTDDQILSFKALYEKYASPSQMFYCLGSAHDTPETEAGQKYRDLFTQGLGEAYYTDLLQGDELFRVGLRHKILGGYHLIALDWEGEDKGHVPQAELDYLDVTLRALTEEDPDKPVFILFHVPDRSDLNAVLSKYPQVICFTAHLHNSLAREDGIKQDRGFTAVACGGVDYYRVDGYNRYNSDDAYLELGEKYNFAHGLYVQIDADNHVYVNRVDGWNGTVIGDTWVVGTDLERAYTDERKTDYTKLTFKDAAMDVTATPTALSIAFDAAKSGDAGPAIYYSINLLRLNGEGVYETVATKDISSRQVFFPNDDGLPDRYYTAVFTNPDGFSDYAICVYACDCWGKSADALIFSDVGDYEADLPAAGHVQYTFRELTEEEKLTGLVTEGEQNVAFRYDVRNIGYLSSNSNVMAVRFHPTYRFKDVTMRCTSGGDTKGTLVFKLYKWTGDYLDTVACEPVDVYELVDFKGSTSYAVTTKTHAAGEYLLTISTPDASEDVGVYHYTLAEGQEAAYVSYNNRRPMRTHIFLEWTNTAVCEHPYVVCQ